MPDSEARLALVEKIVIPRIEEAHEGHFQFLGGTTHSRAHQVLGWTLTSESEVVASAVGIMSSTYRAED